jgi:hypothetical protein
MQGKPPFAPPLRIHSVGQERPVATVGFLAAYLIT